MIFEPAERILLPTKDLLSFIFDNPPYNQDEPVWCRQYIPYLIFDAALTIAPESDICRCPGSRKVNLM